MNQSRSTKYDEQSTKNESGFAAHDAPRTINYPLLTVSLCLVFVAGCATMRSSYAYRATNDECNCEEYRVRDGTVEFLFRANYRMEGGVFTSIDIELTNNSRRDTISTDGALVKISSRNVSYQYNDRFLPLPSMTIPPAKSDEVHLEGKEVSGEDDWTKIAGERLTITVKGVRLGARTLKPQQVEFVPENPKLRSP